jgi:hypothetical protein
MVGDFSADEAEERNLYLRAFVPRFKISLPCNCQAWQRYGGGYFFEMQFYDRPLRRAEDDKDYAAAGQVLLVRVPPRLV